MDLGIPSSDTLVQYLYDPSGPRPYKCGYCKSPDTSITQGVWAYQMTCLDYQALVDRGFQRSGKYVYRPFMKTTCCPQYVIRTDATAFRTTKSQRATVKKMRRYLQLGRTTLLPASGSEADMEELSSSSLHRDERARADEPLALVMSVDSKASSTEKGEGEGKTPAETRTVAGASAAEEASRDTDTARASECSSQQASISPLRNAVVESEGKSETRRDCAVPQQVADAKAKPKTQVNPGLGPDPAKPLCRKAKVIRKEKRDRKLAAQRDCTEHHAMEQSSKVECSETSLPLGSGASVAPQTTAGKAEIPSPSSADLSETSSSKPTLPAFAQDLKEVLDLSELSDDNLIHRFQTRLVPSSRRSSAFQATFEESYGVFKKFQMGVHKEDEADCGEKQFIEFLVDSPLTLEPKEDGMPCGYGSYHQQYLLDGRIFAVGVLDILPKGVLCEYLYYDPAFRYITPGVFTALHEIALTQKFCLAKPSMQYYYMGFYVQSCPKMNYKSRYGASYLLCPETYTYVSLEVCVPKLKAKPYSRLASAETPDAQEEVSEELLDRLIVYGGTGLSSYEAYRSMNGDRRKKLVEEFVKLVGEAVALQCRLYLPDMMWNAF